MGIYMVVTHYKAFKEFFNKFFSSGNLCSSKKQVLEERLVPFILKVIC